MPLCSTPVATRYVAIGLTYVNRVYHFRCQHDTAFPTTAKQNGVVHKETPVEDLRIRLATPQDLNAISEIYNYYVLHSTTTYQTEPETSDDRCAWFQCRGPAHPVTVAECGGEVLGWAALSPFHSRSAYSHTVENSIYVCHEGLRKGIGSALLSDLIQRAAGLGHHTIIAGIDTEQTGSIALHVGFGFEEVAHLHEVGFKFGRWLDVVYLQLLLDGCTDAAEGIR